MHRNEMCVVAFLWTGLGCATAQVVAPPEIRDPKLRELQQKYLPDLEKIGPKVSQHPFPYHFYFSRKLDAGEEQQRGADQRSIRFDTFQGRTVLEITGNYYASYSATLMDTQERARRTLLDVVTPLLEAAIPAVREEQQTQGFAVEVSQHVRRQVLGVTVEGVEHIAYLLPRAAAASLVAATTPAQQEAALARGALYVNAEPAPGWESQAEAWAPSTTPAPVAAAAIVSAPVAPLPAGREATPAVLRERQSSVQPALDNLVRDLDQDAHFASYAPPRLIAFRGGAYLQLSISTTLAETGAGSQYRASALAFDEHIAHLIRPVLAKLTDRSGVDGVDFSTTVRAAGAGTSALAVEFIFPMPALACYEKYDCTGQQLINQGFVLVNGERIGLDLQSAEATR